MKMDDAMILLGIVLVCISIMLSVLYYKHVMAPIIEQTIEDVLSGYQLQDNNGSIIDRKERTHH